jgi:hypothetical protein
MPVLYPVACLNYFILYWVYKALLIKAYQKTSAFNHTLPNMSIGFFKFGIIVHLLLGAVMFTNNQIISSDNEFLKDYERAASTEVSMMARLSNNNRIAARFTSGLGILYLNFCAFCFLFYFFKKTAGAFLFKVLSIVFGVLYRILCCCFIKSKKKEEEEEEERLRELAEQGIDSTSQDIFADFRIGALQDKFNKANQEMNDYEIWMKQD